jgi:hypothetical protein
MESKKINQLATELAPVLSDLTIIGDPTTGISRKITLSQMASLFTGTVEEYPNLASFPLVGTADTIYIALDTNIIYRWNTGTNAYVELSPNIVTSLVFNDANGFDGTIALVGSTATLTITTALTQGSVPFIGTSGALTQDNANLFFDDTNNRLGINTNAPTTALDVFGSGIIGRINGTSTNNAFLGFANAGTNRWSIGNVQSDHRFRIFSETNTSELVSVLQTGEFGIGIANPTTKFHIDGAATALIANLDANVSVAKSISFRSDNSNRINLEVSGTESGSNAGANFFIRRYSDAGALIDTPLTITRSTGAISLATALSGTSADFSSTINAGGDITIPNGSYYNAKRNTGGATINIMGFASGNDALIIKGGTSGAALAMQFQDTSGAVMSLYNTNVGIGTATPAFKLDVNGNANIANGLTANGVMSLSNDGTYGSTYKTLGFTGTTNGTHRILAGTADDMYIAAATARGIYFWTDGSTATRMRILANGNVGIGTSSPSRKLVVLGGNGNQLELDNTGQTYTQAFWKLNGVETGTIWASTSEFHMYTYGSQNILFSTVNIERFRIGNSNTRNAEIDTRGNVIQSFSGTGGTRPAGSSWSMTINQVQFEFETSYMVDAIGFYAPGGVNIQAWATGIIHFMSDGSTNGANYANITSNGISISVSATNAGVYTVTFTNTSGSSMGDTNARILKINRMN